MSFQETHNRNCQGNIRIKISDRLLGPLTNEAVISATVIAEGCEMSLISTGT